MSVASNEDIAYWRSLGLLTSRQLAERAGVTYRQVDYWCREGYIVPAIESDGSGTRRLWGREHVPQVKAMGRVTRALGAHYTGGKNGATKHILIRVAEHWKRGWADLEEGVRISWPTVHQPERIEEHER